LEIPSKRVNQATLVSRPAGLDDMIYASLKTINHAASMPTYDHAVPHERQYEPGRSILSSTS
jgi:hypothetical protein